jgi:hypothetical protein
MEVNGQLNTPVGLTPGERAPGTHWIGGWVGPRGGLDAKEKSSCSCQESNPDSSAVQSVDLRYTGLLFSTYDGDQARHSGDVGGHAGTFVR